MNTVKDEPGGGGAGQMVAGELGTGPWNVW